MKVFEGSKDQNQFYLSHFRGIQFLRLKRNDLVQLVLLKRHIVGQIILENRQSAGPIRPISIDLLLFCHSQTVLKFNFIDDVIMT